MPKVSWDKPSLHPQKSLFKPFPNFLIYCKHEIWLKIIAHFLGNLLINSWELMTLLSIQVPPKATFVLNDLCRCKYSGKFFALGSLQGETSQILHSTVNQKPEEKGRHIPDLLHIPSLAKQGRQPTAYSMQQPWLHLAFAAKWEWWGTWQEVIFCTLDSYYKVQSFLFTCSKNRSQVSSCSYLLGYN